MIVADKPHYIKWIIKEDGVTFEDGTPLTCFRIEHESDDAVLDNWALHIRKHYVSDEDFRQSLIDTEMSAEDYLKEYVIPQKGDPFWATSRANDITEILLSDLFEFVLGYIVLRGKQENRSGKTQSEHGTDILALKFKNEGKANSDDELCAIEVKAGLSSDDYAPLALAKIDSDKYDSLRYSHTLDYFRKKYRTKGLNDLAEQVARFQKKSEESYRKTFIGAGVISRDEIKGSILINLKDEDKVEIQINGADLKLTTNNNVFLLHGNELMDLTHKIYERIKL